MHTRQRGREIAAGTGSGTIERANSRHRSESGFLLDLKPIDPSIHRHAASSQPAGIIVYSPGRAESEPAQPGGTAASAIGIHVPFVNL
jgi:hypothetical protein